MKSAVLKGALVWLAVVVWVTAFLAASALVKLRAGGWIALSEFTPPAWWYAALVAPPAALLIWTRAGASR